MYAAVPPGMRAALLILRGLLLGVLVGTSLFADDTNLLQSPAANTRPYDQGQLTEADYRAKRPDSLPNVGPMRMQAFTWTRIEYSYKYAYTQRGSNSQVTLSEFHAMAAVDQSVSWNAMPRDTKLLDHEQGHFDIAHISALRLQAEVDTLRSNNNGPTGRGRTLALAIQNLEKTLASLSLKHENVAKEAHVQYDLTTSHGTIGSMQARARAEHQEEIAALLAKQ